jgi:hypothetical protein
MCNRKSVGNMLWIVPFVFAVAFGFNGCGDGNNTSVPPGVPPASIKPVANAGSDLSNISPGTVIPLNGSASFDPNGIPLTYNWTLLTKPAGSTASLANPTSVSPTLSIDRDGAYTVQLIVNGAETSEPDSVLITSAATFRKTLATDNFNRADSADMGSAWDTGYIGKNSAAIVSQQVRAVATNPSDPKSAASYSAVTPDNNQWCEITLGLWTGSEDREFGCILRAHAPPLTNWYWCYARANGPRNAAIVKHHVNSAGDINLASDFSVVWAAGDKLRCEAHGTALRLYRIPNGTMDERRLLSATDGEWTSGKAGLLLWMFTDGDLSHASVDDFSMGEF